MAKGHRSLHNLIKRFHLYLKRRTTRRRPQRAQGPDVQSPGTHTARPRLTGFLRKRRAPAAAWALLAAAALIPLGLLAPTAAYTAEPSKLTITSLAPIPSSVAFDHASRISVNAGTGNTAYCAQGYLRISEVGSTFTRYGSLDIPELDYVMYHGYDGKVVTSLFGLDELESQVATTAAVWLAIGEQRADVLGITTSTGTYFHGNQYAEGRYELIRDAGTKAAAWQLYQDALAYMRAGGGGVEAGCAVYWAPDERLVDGVFRQGLVTADKAVEVTFTKVSANATITDGNEAYAYAGAAYTIYRAATDERIAAITTDEEGHATCALPYGDYYAVETAAPRGFTVNLDPIPFTVERGTAGAQVDLADAPGTVSLTVQKKDSATDGAAQPGATLEGAVYELTDANGDVHTATSDASGRLSFTQIPFGPFTVVETVAPTGYTLDTTVHEYEVGSDDPGIDAGVVELTDTFAEDVIAFDLEIAKVKGDDVSWDEADGHPEPAAGVTFEVVSNTTDAVVGTLTTGDDGFADTRNDPGLWFGEGTRPSGVSGAIPYDAAGYTVREVPETVPAGFDVVDAWQITAEEMADGAVLRYCVRDDALATSLQIVKEDAVTGQRVPLAGFSFQIIDTDGNPVSMTNRYPSEEVLDTFTTGDDGAVALPERLAPGTYLIREVTAVAPYLQGADVPLFVSDSFEETVPCAVAVFPDDQAMGIARIQKTCSGAPGDHDGDCSLAGATFDVVAVGDIVSPDGTVRAVDGAVVAQVTTDETGYAETPELWLGAGEATYAFVETQAPAGHVLDPTPHEFTLTYQDTQTEHVYADVEVSNEPTEIILTKTVMGTDEPLAGATFALWSADDELRVEPEDGAAAIAVRAEVNDGIELAATLESGQSEDGNGTPESITLRYDEVRDAFIATNVPAGSYELLIGGEVVGIIAAPAGSCAYGSYREGTFSAEDHLLRSGIEPELLTTGADGTLRITHLTAGSYRLAEVDAPDGFLVDGATRYFSIDEDGMTEGLPSHPVEIADDYTKVELLKRDITNEDEVEGATLTLLDSEGNSIDHWVSGAEPHRIDALPPGDYTLVEEMTPHTYDQATAVDFTVLPTGSIQTVTMYDEPIEVSGEVDKRQEIADPVAADTEPDGDGANRAPVSVSEDGSFDYTVDFRSTASTWVDEFTVTDEITGAADGLAELVSITTPQAYGDFDGKLNVWYRTVGASADAVDDGAAGDDTAANATRSDGHVNPWLDDESTAEVLVDDGRAVDYTGWQLWAEGVSAAHATELSVADLDLAPGERVVAVRLEYGRVEAGFASRLDGWDREDLKHEHDDLADAPAVHEGEQAPDGTAYAPLALHMRATTAYVVGAPLHNGVRLDLFRNGGNTGSTTGLEEHDADAVIQEAQSRIERLAQTGAAILTPTFVTGAVALLLYAGHSARRRR